MAIITSNLWSRTYSFLVFIVAQITSGFVSTLIKLEQHFDKRLDRRASRLSSLFQPTEKNFATDGASFEQICDWLNFKGHPGPWVTFCGKQEGLIFRLAARK